MAKSPSTDTDAADTPKPKKPKKEKPKKEKPKTTRDDELSEKEEHSEALTRIAGQVEEGYRSQSSRSEDQADYWEIYECILNDNQAYNGNSQAYISLVADAVDARKTRFSGQLFPLNGRFVEVTSETGEYPHAEMALVEHYIEKCKLRTDIVAPLIVNGDVEGQYNLYVTWENIARHVVSRETVKEGGSEVQTVKEEVIWDSGPKIECVPDADVCILPATSDSIQEAISNGGSVSITRRWSKTKIQQMIDDGDLVKEVAEALLGDMTAVQKGKDIKKEHVSATGIKAKGNWFLAREVWHSLKVDGEQRVCRSFFGAGDRTFLGTKLNPYWCDLVPLISAPVKKMSGSFKGASLLKRVASLQYSANDFLNEAMDSATYAMLPIVKTDPEKNPKTSTMILDLAAIWECDPKSTEFAAFPKLWEQGFEIISSLKNQIQQSLGVNPSMIPATSGKSKRSQADIANEQAVDLLTTADSVTVIENSVLTPLIQRIVAYDMQFRHDDLLIPMFGMMGKQAKMERIPPIQANNRYEFKWLGVQSSRNAQQIQQKIGFLNVMKQFPPQMYRNHRIDATAMIEEASESIFGPRIGPMTFVDLRDELSMDQDEENMMLMQGYPVPVSAMDNDQEHIQKLQPILANDITGMARVHLQAHMQQMQAKAMQAQAQAAQMMGMGGPQGPPGGTREGAQPGQGRPAQGPPGQIGNDDMARAGTVTMPRKVG